MATWCFYLPKFQTAHTRGSIFTVYFQFENDSRWPSFHNTEPIWSFSQGEKWHCAIKPILSVSQEEKWQCAIAFSNWSMNCIFSTCVIDPSRCPFMPMINRRMVVWPSSWKGNWTWRRLQVKAQLYGEIFKEMETWAWKSGLSSHCHWQCLKENLSTLLLPWVDYIGLSTSEKHTFLSNLMHMCKYSVQVPIGIFEDDVICLSTL